MLRATVRHYVDTVEPVGSRVLVRRFGLRGHEALTLEETGQEVGLTRERVRQIQLEVLRTLREGMASAGFDRQAVLG